MLHTPEQLKVMIEKMQAVSNGFYREATQVGNHAFIEFTGFMNEYIKLCQEALAKGDDFTEANVHVGKPLFEMHPFHAAYLGEKFGCIFATTFAGRKELIDAFVAAAFGPEAVERKKAKTKRA